MSQPLDCGAAPRHCRRVWPSLWGKMHMVPVSCCLVALLSDCFLLKLPGLPKGTVNSVRAGTEFHFISFWQNLAQVSWRTGGPPFSTSVLSIPFCKLWPWTPAWTAAGASESVPSLLVWSSTQNPGFLPNSFKPGGSSWQDTQFGWQCYWGGVQGRGGMPL